MLTPPLHFAVSCAPPQSTASTSSQILYRGAIPICRNLEFVDRLQLKTILVFSKKEPKADSDVVMWADGRGGEVKGKGKGVCHKVDIKWFKAGKMEGEELGMGRAEVNEVLKIIVQPSYYPLYIADADGLTHSSLIIGALRKLMGWHQDSILNELGRFDADDEDLPFASFFSSYLSPTPSDGLDSKAESASLQLPHPPYPCWLWPSSAVTTPPLQAPKGRSRSASISMPEKPAPIPDPIKQPEIFPHPPTFRRHPTMRLVFPPSQPAEALPISSPKKLRRVSFHASPVPSPTLAAVSAAEMAASGPIASASRAVEGEGKTLLLNSQASPKLTKMALVDPDGAKSAGEEEEYEEEEYEEDEDEDEDEDDEDEDDEDDNDKAAPSQLISALDLEGL